MKTLRTFIGGVHLLAVIYFFCRAAILFTDEKPGAGFYLLIFFMAILAYFIFRPYYKS